MSARQACFTCKCGIGEAYSTKESRQEPFGPAIVCVPCYESLERRGIPAYESLVREGTIRIPIELPEPLVPRRRGRRPKPVDARILAL